MSNEQHLRELLQRLVALRLMRRTPPECNLPPAQLGILFLVSRMPGCGVLDLAEAMHVRPPTVSVAVRRLRQGNWLEIRPDPNDRRARPLYLTPQGESLVQRMRAFQEQLMTLFLSGLQPAEQRQFLDLFDRALTTLENQLDEL